MKKKHRIVVLGAGFGGLVTAVRLSKKLGRHHEIVLVDRDVQHVYTPWLYDVATSFLIDPEKSEVQSLARVGALSIPHVVTMKGRRNLRFRKATVSGLDHETKHVLLEGGNTLQYDTLVIALGAQTTYYGIEGMKEYSMSLKTLEEGMKVRDKIESLLHQAIMTGEGQKRVVIVGGGATGSETAAELMNFLRSCDKYGVDVCHLVHVSLVDAAPTVLGQFSPYVKKHAIGRLRMLGVDLHPNTAVTKVDSKKIYTKDGEIPYDCLVWAGGVQPNSVLTDFDISKDERGRIQVDSALQVAGMDGMFAIGDCVAFTDPRTGKNVPPTAWAAIDEAIIASKNILAHVKKGDMTSYKPPKVYPAIITAGGRYAAGGAYGFNLKGFPAFFLRRMVDLRYFLKVLPFFYALKFWGKGTAVLLRND